jgi:ubiquinone/menaquinone biosynthesis C-methylase UbiE
VSFKDHFSGHAAEYAAARPTYPDALFDWLGHLAPESSTVLDCGCGNGQASVALAARFARVVATDASPQQIEHAAPHPRVEYHVATAEASGLADRSVGLVTAAQAYHWFDHPRFHAELARVLAPGSCFVAWGYGLMRIAPAVDALVDELYQVTTARYWPPERALIDTEFRTIACPFAAVAAPEFEIERRWTLAEVLRYLRTWSALRSCAQAEGRDPLDALAARFTAAWGDADAPRLVRWRVFVRAVRP